MCNSVSPFSHDDNHWLFYPRFIIIVEGGGRSVGENKYLTGKKARYNPYTKEFKKCRICKQTVHQVGSHYCQACAYKVGKQEGFSFVLCQKYWLFYHFDFWKRSVPLRSKQITFIKCIAVLI